MKKAWKILLRILAVYAAVIVLILTATIITVMLSFAIIVADDLFGLSSLRPIADDTLTPWSERLWHWFVLITPGG
ncbi:MULTISPECIES: hypothetical protein [Sinobaca]|uniref:Uncharacterized protein n=1 Tax=Sinobaca qinghaiensis TaxID=342944 RepID=A0A419V2M6_9BACL|nr:MULTISPECIES: hypothetical protein [Sinobaca]RKD72787.1 hypothetical protein ATL39_1983 [Sinobaca qinghaiensis]